MAPHKSQRRLGFLDLPGEIRNEIYAYHFEDEIWVDLTPNATHILRSAAIRPLPAIPTPKIHSGGGDDHGAAATTAITAPPSPKPQKLKCHTLLRGRALRPKNSTALPPPYTKWDTSYGALTLTCKQIRHETACYFLSAPFFTVSSPRALRAFLATTHPAHLGFVRKLHVAHATYGDPGRPAHEVWKTRHLDAWARAMREAAEKLVGLQALRVRLVLNERPLVFDLQAPWVQALMPWAPACVPDDGADAAAGRAGGRNKKMPLQVHITVQSIMISNEVWQQMPTLELANAYVELHQLFGEAVRRKLLGWSDEDAMVEYNLTKFGKYKRLADTYPIP